MRLDNADDVDFALEHVMRAHEHERPWWMRRVSLRAQRLSS